MNSLWVFVSYLYDIIKLVINNIQMNPIITASEAKEIASRSQSESFSTFLSEKDEYVDKHGHYKVLNSYQREDHSINFYLATHIDNRIRLAAQMNRYHTSCFVSDSANMTRFITDWAGKCDDALYKIETGQYQILCFMSDGNIIDGSTITDAECKLVTCCTPIDNLDRLITPVVLQFKKLGFVVSTEKFPLYGGSYRVALWWDS